MRFIAINQPTGQVGRKAAGRGSLLSTFEIKSGFLVIANRDSEKFFETKRRIQFLIIFMCRACE